MDGILSWILEHKWAISQPALNAIIDVVSRSDLSSEAISRQIHGQHWDKYIDNQGSPVNPSALMTSNLPILDGSRNVMKSKNVAILPVVGPIFPRANLFTELSGASSLQDLSIDFNVAMDNDSIDTIILNVDSPGGEVTGVSEFSNMVFEGRAKKKIIGYVYGMGASAGYWILSAAEEIVINETAEVGSIGVVAGFTSTKERDEKKGIKKIEIVSSQSPNKRLDISTNEGLSQIQTIVDDIANVFVASVAKHRGVDSKHVLENYGQGKMFVGSVAVDNGLADKLGSLDSLITLYQAKGNFYLNHGGFMNEQELMAKHPELYNQVKAKGFSEGKVEGKKEAESEIETKISEAKESGAKEENERIKNIESIEAVGGEKVISELKFDRTQNKSTVAEAILSKQAEERKKISGKFKTDGENLSGKLADVGNNSNDGDEDEAELKSLIQIAGESANKRIKA